jgi:hypothetical protein
VQLVRQGEGDIFSQVRVIKLLCSAGQDRSGVSVRTWIKCVLDLKIKKKTNYFIKLVLKDYLQEKKSVI